MRRKICVVTGTRAEYGLLYWLLKQIQNDDDLTLQIIATGMHMSPEFGLTYKLIEQDGFFIDEKVEILLSSDTPQAVAKSMGLGTISLTDAYTRLQPDIIVLLGDRFEILAAAQAAMIMRIPVAHIHGGEITEGAIDDSIRHAITKMAHIHFPATESYRQRVIQLGEQPNQVFNVGALGVEGIRSFNLLERKELASQLGIANLDKYFLITLHPTTLEDTTAEHQIDVLLDVLDAYKDDYQFLFTRANADSQGRIINERLEKFVALNNDRSALYHSMGQLKYLSAMKHCEVIIGNSSSGILEAPSMQKPTVDIGIRQKGRLKASSIVECEFNYEDIKKAIDYALSDQMKRTIKTMNLMYGEGDTSYQIKEVLKKVDLDNITIKKFYDLI